MKKSLSLALVILFALSIFAVGCKKEEAATTDTAVTETTAPAPETAAVDTAMTTDTADTPNTRMPAAPTHTTMTAAPAATDTTATK